MSSSKDNILGKTPMKKKNNCIIDFIKRIFGINNKLNEMDNDYRILSNEEILVTINNNIDPILLSNIQALQEKAYYFDKSGMELVECCVCLEDNVKMIPLECTHTLCAICYDRLISNNYYTCPICRIPLKVVHAYKFYAVIIQFNYSCIGILYMPPIYVEEDDKWMNHEVFYDVSRHNKTEVQNFKKTYERINKEEYVIILSKPQIKCILDKILFSKN